MDYILEEKEEEYQIQRERLIIEEATILILDGESRDDALSIARELEDERDQAIRDGEYVEDEHGYPESFFDISNQRSIDHNNPQHLAIYLELCEREGIEPE